MSTDSLRAGDWVEVKTREEILTTLDAQGGLNGLPFMPEMLQYCGRRLRVYKSAHKTCDTIQDWSNTPRMERETLRRMEKAVLLEGLRCDGTAHGGCQASCLIYWKTDWLRPLTSPDAPPASSASKVMSGGSTLDSLECATRVPSESTGEIRYRCQATDHLLATSPLHWWEPAPYVKDLTSRNIQPLTFLRYGLLSLYNYFQRLLGRPTHPYVRGRAGRTTPTEELDLKPGELVEVRSWEEIMLTLDANGRNRGLSFDVEMIPYCGGKFRVLSRVEKIIDERTGEMLKMPNGCIILENVVCGGCLSQYRLFCPRAIYPYWREIWLRRVE